VSFGHPINSKTTIFFQLIKVFNWKKKRFRFFIDFPYARKPGSAVGGAGGWSASLVKLDFFGRSFGGAAAGAASFKKMSIAKAAMERHARVGKGWARWGAAILHNGVMASKNTAFFKCLKGFLNHNYPLCKYSLGWFFVAGFLSWGLAATFCFFVLSTKKQSAKQNKQYVASALVTKTVTQKTTEVVARGRAKKTGGTLQNTAFSTFNAFCKVAGFFALGIGWDILGQR
jgi:hypothetical protein